MTRRAHGFVAAMALATPSLPATEPNPPLRAADVFALERVADPQISPDGRRVVYERRFADVMTDKRYSNLWMVGVDGQGARALTTGRRNDSEPRFSPDGSRLAYISEEGEQPLLVVRYMDSGETQVVARPETAPAGLSWSPDGKLIAYVATVKEKPPALALLPTPPAGATWAEPARIVDRMVYRFNGSGYLPNGFSQVFVVPAEGGTPRQLTKGPFHHGKPTIAGVAATTWTKDGRILIVANRREDWETEPFDCEIYELNPKDGTLQALTRRRGPDRNPVASPDGRFIAFIGMEDRYQGFQTEHLSVMNRDGSGLRELAVPLDREPESPTWAADSAGLYFTYDDQGDTKLGHVALLGKVRTISTALGSGFSAYGGGASLSISRDGTLAFTRGSSRSPGDVVVLPRGVPEPLRVSAVNDDLLEARSLGEVEEIWFDSSHDKRRIQGWILKPPGFDPGKKYPLLLEIHGGPFANYGPRFSFEKQAWAGMGYLVLYVNPRGSTSYGEEFGNLIHHAYPGDDFHDLMSGVDAVLAKGYVDADNLFVGGGSGGGVLTAWTVGRTTRFRAAVAYYPVINWESWALTADIPILGVKYWFPGNPWDHVEHYAKRSLLSVVKNVKTPTMVITGEEDYRTPMSESEQYYTALKLLGVESLLIRVPGEPHGLSRRPSHHQAKILEIAAWYERHRKP